MDYPTIAIIILLAAALVGFLAWKNLKDEKVITKEMTREEMKPEEFDEKNQE